MQQRLGCWQRHKWRLSCRNYFSSVLRNWKLCDEFTNPMCFKHFWTLLVFAFTEEWSLCCSNDCRGLLFEPLQIHIWLIKVKFLAGSTWLLSVFFCLIKSKWQSSCTILKVWLIFLINSVICFNYALVHIFLFKN